VPGCQTAIAPAVEPLASAVNEVKKTPTTAVAKGIDLAKLVCISATPGFLNLRAFFNTQASFLSQKGPGENYQTIDLYEEKE